MSIPRSWRKVLLMPIAILIINTSYGQASCGEAQYPNSCPIVEQPIINVDEINCLITFSYTRCSSNNNCLFWAFEQNGDYQILGSPFFAGQVCTLAGGQDEGDCAGGDDNPGFNNDPGYNPIDPLPAFCTYVNGGNVYGTLRHVSNNVDPDECEISITSGTVIDVLTIQYNGDCSILPPFTLTWDARNSTNCNAQCNAGTVAFPYIYTQDSLFSTTLPVTLTRFVGYLKNDKIFLEWNTDSEVNNKGFEVLRAREGSSIFEPIGFVEGYGNSSEPVVYHFVDENPRPGDNIYRLRQVDFDGTSVLTKTIVLRKNYERSLSVAPNPSQGFDARISIVTEQKESSLLSIFSMDGRRVFSKSIVLNEGENIIDLSSVELESGVYFAAIPGEAGLLKKKFVVY